MTDIQNEFDTKFPKEEKEIELKRKNFRGQQLIIEDYLELEKLYLLNNKNADKIILRNLEKLQECEIFNCGVKELVIENCFQIKKLDIQNNLLTNLEFLADLEKLEEVKLDDNTKIIDFLLAKQKESEAKYQRLKRFLKKEVLNPLDELSKKAERKASVSSSPGNTDELMLVTKKDVESVKEINEKLETELNQGLNKIQELKKELAETKKNLIGAQEELEDKQLALEALEQKLKLSPSSELQERIDKYKTKIKELKAKEGELQIELVRTKATLERAEDEVDHLRKRSSTSTQQFNFLGGNQSNLNLVGNNIIQNSQIIYHLQYNNYQFQQELTNLKQNYQLLDSTTEPFSDKQKLKKTILFLATKQIFATTRQNTINKLIDIYNNQQESNQKFDKLATFGDTVSNSGWIANIVPGAETAVNLLGKGISAVANYFKDDTLTEYNQKFEDCLFEDQKALTLLQESYQSLNSAQNNQNKISPLIIEMLKLNQSPISHYDIFTISGIQKNEELSAEKMKEAINSLRQNFTIFTNEFQRETTQYADELEKIFDGIEGGTLQKEIVELLNRLVSQKSEKIEIPQDLQNQIQTKNLALENLINSAKEKLKSKSAFSSKVEERNQKLNSFFKNFPTNQDEFIKNLENIKENLSKKLTWEEINNLCQTQTELTKLQAELENLQQSQQQTQILQQNPPKSN